MSEQTQAPDPDDTYELPEQDNEVDLGPTDQQRYDAIQAVSSQYDRIEQKLNMVISILADVEVGDNLPHYEQGKQQAPYPVRHLYNQAPQEARGPGGVVLGRAGQIDPTFPTTSPEPPLFTGAEGNTTNDSTIAPNQPDQPAVTAPVLDNHEPAPAQPELPVNEPVNSQPDPLTVGGTSPGLLGNHGEGGPGAPTAANAPGGGQETPPADDTGPITQEGSS